MGDFRHASRFFTGLVLASRPLMAGLRFRASGLENLPGAGGFVVASNHVSNLDPWPLGIPLHPRQVHFMAKAELYGIPVVRTVLVRAQAFPVRRTARDSESFRTAVRYAREGGVIAVFPEGTRRNKGFRKRHAAKPHLGAARIALAAGVPLVPAAIAGTDRLRRLGPVRVAYGRPLEFDGDGGPRREAAREATALLMAEIARLEAAL